MVLSDRQRTWIVLGLQLAVSVVFVLLVTFTTDERWRTAGMFALLIGFYVCWYVLMATRSFNGSATKPKRRRGPSDF